MFSGVLIDAFISEPIVIAIYWNHNSEVVENSITSLLIEIKSFNELTKGMIPFIDLKNIYQLSKKLLKI